MAGRTGKAEQTGINFSDTSDGKAARLKVFVNGIVQGVGFRPFVYNLARENSLSGFVTNTSGGVEIEVEGTPSGLNFFLEKLRNSPPPLSVITSIHTEAVSPNGQADFEIIPSKSDAKVQTLISPDVAVCPDCLKELFSPADRRYRYPFINCTNCGPRYTIIENIPYDRPATSMKHFRMCPACQAEYDNPSNRRFHAQPNACPECGPQVALYKPDRENVETEDPISDTATLLKSGHIVAIKGLGGFHLAVDARNESAVLELRRRKHREEKPFAVMVRNLEVAASFSQLSNEEENALSSPQSPIVLLQKKNVSLLAPSIAPGNDRVGVMLPYTPLHHLLLSSELDALVMTSANLSDEPICIENSEAFDRLFAIADYFLLHNRDIYLRCDDSVVIHLAGTVRQIRRSRGYAPRPVFVASEGAPILAVGGELKNTVCLLKGNQAFLSQHIGDLENLEACTHFQKTIGHLERILETRPELLVHDLHPRYLSTEWAKGRNTVPALGVQHHHAHLAACMAENKLTDPVIGIIMDGTGYGTDGTIWGGEVLIGNYAKVVRFAHFEPMPLPGGDAAIKAPWRIAASYLYKAFGESLPDLPLLRENDAQPIIEMVRRNFNSPMTSSLGRLFDAVATLSGGKPVIRYEGQAAIEFMQKADGLAVPPFDFDVIKSHGSRLLPVTQLIRSVAEAVKNSESLSRLSSRFHRTLIELFIQVSKEARAETEIRDVVLGGGVFQNSVLFEGVIPALEKQGFRVFTHREVPTNDGGLSLGQALIGREFLRNRYEGVTLLA